jgi:signal transduction histidine kinase
MGGVLTNQQLSYLVMIESEGRRLLDMINRSLDLFKIEQGMYALRPEAVDLLSVAQEVIGHHALLMRVKNLSAIILVDDRPAAETDTFVVPGERRLCYSLLANLLKNACEASPEGESVTLRFDGARRLSIRNRGAVPESVRDRFFEKFSTAGKEHGTGLGTYSARLIAEVHRARIGVDTSEPDFTTVTVWFPSAPGVAIETPL